MSFPSRNLKVALAGSLLAVSLSAWGNNVFKFEGAPAHRLVGVLGKVGASSNVSIKAGHGRLRVSLLHCGRALAGVRECRFFDHEENFEGKQKRNTNAATSNALVGTLVDLGVVKAPALTATVDDISCNWIYEGLHATHYRCEVTTPPSAAPTPETSTVDLECENSATHIWISGATRDGESGKARLHSEQPLSQGGSGHFEGEFEVVRSSGPTFHRHRRNGSYILFASPQKNSSGNHLFALALTYRPDGSRANEFITAHDPAKLSGNGFVSYGGVVCKPALPAPRLENAERP